jgi:hypothetical protein
LGAKEAVRLDLHPSFVHELGEIDSAALQPPATRTGCHEVRILEKGRRGESWSDRVRQPRDRKFDCALFQKPIERHGIANHHAEIHSRVLAREVSDRLRNDRAGDDLRCANPQLPGGRIGEKSDILDALTQLVEHRDAALYKRPAIGGGLDPLPAPVEKTHPERMLEIGDGFRNRRLRDTQTANGLSHAAGIDDREENIEVAQFEAVLEAFGVRQRPSPRSFQNLMLSSDNSIIQL